MAVITRLPEFSSKKGLSSDKCRNFSVTPSYESVQLTWSDPEDTLASDETVLVKWGYTKLVRKVGGYPQHDRDGETLIVNATRNFYAEQPYIDSGLTGGVMYYYALFTSSNTGVISNNMIGCSAIPLTFTHFTIQINEFNSDPDTCCTYVESNSNKSIPVGSPEWDKFFGHRPCLLKEGKVVGYLDPNNFRKFEDGTNIDYSIDGDVMIEFPRRGLKISRPNTNIIQIDMTDNPNDSNYNYYAHQRGDIAKDNFYIGVYEGMVDNSRLRSWSAVGKSKSISLIPTPDTNSSLDSFRSYAHNNGDGYEVMAFYQLVYIQAMYLLKYKNLNSQATVGKGYTSLRYSRTIPTGHTDTYGMNYGDTSIWDDAMKLFGIENLWGNISTYLDGLTMNDNEILASTDNFNNAGIGYTNIGSIKSSYESGYISRVYGTSENGFIGIECNGSSSTYFSDYAEFSTNMLFVFGGDLNQTNEIGLFYLTGGSEQGSLVGARLMYL